MILTYETAKKQLQMLRDLNCSKTITDAQVAPRLIPVIDYMLKQLEPFDAYLPTECPPDERAENKRIGTAMKKMKPGQSVGKDNGGCLYVNELREDGVALRIHGQVLDDVLWALGD